MAEGYTREELTRRRPEDTNLFGGEFTPFRDIWQDLAGDLGITTKRMRRNAQDIAMQEARVADELDSEMSESLNAAMAFVEGDELGAARVQALHSQRERLAELARGAPNRQVREQAMMQLAQLSTDPVLQGVAEVRTALGEQAWKRFNEVRDDLVRESEPFQLRRQAYGNMQAAIANPSGVSDITLITAFMKMQDPTSVVREGEYATAQEVGGVNEKLLGLYNSLVAGTGSLTDEQRQEFFTQGTNLYRAAREEQLQRNATARASARLGGVDEQYLGVLGINVDPAEVEYLRPPPPQKAPSALEGGEPVATPAPARALNAFVDTLSHMAQSARRAATGAELRRMPDGRQIEVYPDGTSREVERETQFYNEQGDLVELVDRGNGRTEWRMVNQGSGGPQPGERPRDALRRWWQGTGLSFDLPKPERPKNR